MRSSRAGCVDQTDVFFLPSAMPIALSESGRTPGCRLPRRRSAAIIGDGVPRRRAEPASAAYSRRRENQKTTSEARTPSASCRTVTSRK